MDRLEEYLASISMSLEVIAEELRKRNETPKPVQGQSSEPREIKQRITK
jgi:hypothetical protein